MIRLQTLGALGASAPGGAVRVGRKELALFAYLARRSPQPIPRAQLAALLWGERQETQARQSLRQALVRLKRALPLPLEIHPERVALLPGGWELDVTALESNLGAGRLEESVAHWRGEFLEGAEDIGAEGYRHWVEVEREALRQLVIRAFERLVDAAEHAGDWRAATDWTERWTRVAPLDERAHGRLVRALRLAGRSDEAAARHAAFLARVRLELGVEPSRDLLRLGSELAQRAPAGPAGRPPRARPSPGSRALFTPDLVGRATAVASLSACWDAARAGSAGAVLVDGEEGIGKTRLCEEFLRSVTLAGDRPLVLRARGYEAGRDMPWAVTRELLAPLKHAAGVPGASPGALAAVGRLVPAIRERFPVPGTATPEWSPEEAVAEMLAAAAGESPLIVFLDDLASADRPTQRLIVSLTRRRLGGRILLLLTARSDDLERSPALAELRTGTALHRVRLHPLPESDVEALLGSMLDLSAQDRRRLAERLATEGGGNPLHVVQITSALLDEGHVAPDATGTWRLEPQAGPGHPLPLPASVREAVGRRLDWLSDAARHLANSAAVLGRPASRHVLGELAGLSPVDLDSALDELIARRLLRAAPLPKDSYEYAHELTRRTVYDLLPTLSRRRLHRAAWLVLRSAGKDADARAARAYHRARAGSAAWPLVAWTRSRRAAAAAAAGAMTVLAALAVAAVALRPAEPAVVAVGAIRDHTGPDGGGVTSAVADLLATNMARVRGVQMVSTARLYEVRAQMGTLSDSSWAIARAARQAGATEVLEGSLYRMPDRSLRLDLRRVDLRSGALRAAFSARGSDPFTLVDAATEELARGLEIRGGGPALRVTNVTTASLVAYRFYEEGLRAFHRDPRSAQRLFEAALVEDSTFAMAAYYVAKCRVALGDEFGARAPLLRAARLAARAAERERLLIRTTLAVLANDPTQLVMAESLATRYPNEPDGHLLVGQALAGGGDFLGAVARFRRVLEMDSLSFRGGAVRCRACEALSGLVGAYQWADSLEAAVRIQRTMMQRLGNSGMGLEVAWILSRQGRTDEALATMRQVATADYQPTAFRATAGIRSGAFAEVDAMLHENLRAGAADLRGEALWYLSISLRHQGRLAEALAVARRLRRVVEPSSVGLPIETVVEAQTLFEMGRARAAAALFDSIGTLITDTLFPSRAARHVAWEFTHVATALAAMGDTVPLVRLADTIETYGGRSAYGRDRRLHHYVRGLLWNARGRPAAAERQFRAALHSPNLGYTRINLELGGTLLRLERPAEAARILASALRGELHASNLYVTHTELHELLARAHDAAGQPDSAVVHYRWVVNAWKNADPMFHERREAARRRLAVLYSQRRTRAL